MTMSYQVDVSEQDPDFRGASSTDLVATTLDELLPVIAETGAIDYKALMPMEATLPTVGALIKHEFENLSFSEDAADSQRADRLRRAAGGILDIAEKGHLTTMEDAFEIVALVEERNPSLRRVEDLLVDHKFTPSEVGSFYSAMDSIGTTITMTKKLLDGLGLDFRSEDDVETAYEVIETVKTVRNIDPRFNDIAADVVLGLAASGKTLGDIMDGQVF